MKINMKSKSKKNSKPCDQTCGWWLLGLQVLVKVVRPRDQTQGLRYQTTKPKNTGTKPKDPRDQTKETKGPNLGTLPWDQTKGTYFDGCWLLWWQVLVRVVTNQVPSLRDQNYVPRDHTQVLRDQTQEHRDQTQVPREQTCGWQY